MPKIERYEEGYTKARTSPTCRPSVDEQR